MTKQDHKTTLGAHLRAARTEAGLSIRQLALLAGINHSYLVKLETDQNDNPSAEKLQSLAEVLEIDPTELLSFIGLKPSSTLPPPRIYFRKQYGMTDAEAIEVMKLIQQYAEERTNNVDEGGDKDED